MLRIKPLLFVFSILVLLDIMVFGLTTSGAWFVDSASSGMTIITAGSLDLQVTRLEEKETQAKIMPGSDFSPIGAFCNRNSGSTNLKYRGIFQSTSPSGRVLLPFVTLKVERQDAGVWAEEARIFGVAEKETDALARYFLFPDQEVDQETRYIVSGILQPHEEICYRLSAKIDETVPEEYHQSQLEFSLHLYTTQTINPGW